MDKNWEYGFGGMVYGGTEYGEELIPSKMGMIIHGFGIFAMQIFRST